MKKLFVILSIVSLAITSSVHAEEMVISGNGEGSANNVQINASNTSSVAQNNTASVDNTVAVDANTGGNSASDNTGGNTNIDTGNVDATVNVDNQMNASVAQLGCCPTGIEGLISGNGSDSSNNVTFNATTNTTIVSNNNANITTTIHGFANTGNNTANGNVGNVSIKTGNIKASENISNKNINISETVGTAGIGGDVFLKIDGNGSESVNDVSVTLDTALSIFKNNFASITNDTDWDLNTGGNQANGNIGNVDLRTGDILFESTIENGPINVDKVTVVCCDKPGENPPPPPPPPPPVIPPPTVVPPPTDNPPSGPGPDNKPGKGGETLGAAIGGVLPVTGNFAIIFLTIGGFLMMLMGWYLRLRSGNAPPTLA